MVSPFGEPAQRKDTGIRGRGTMQHPFGSAPGGDTEMRHGWSLRCCSCLPWGGWVPEASLLPFCSSLRGDFSHAVKKSMFLCVTWLKPEPSLLVETCLDVLPWPGSTRGPGEGALQPGWIPASNKKKCNWVQDPCLRHLHVRQKHQT